MTYFHGTLIEPLSKDTAERRAVRPCGVQEEAGVAARRAGLVWWGLFDPAGSRRSRTGWRPGHASPGPCGLLNTVFSAEV